MDGLGVRSLASLENEDALPARALLEGLLFTLHTSDVAVPGYFINILSRKC